MMNTRLYHSLPSLVKEGSSFAAVDLGTIACRLSIVQYKSAKIQMIDHFRQDVHLGDSFFNNYIISEKVILRAVEVLSICAEKIQKFHVNHVRCVATEACRQAKNREDFFHLIYEKTGINLELISPTEEARLAVLSIEDMLDPSLERAVVFDIGGGSTQIMWVTISPSRLMKVVEYLSLPMGVMILPKTNNQSLNIKSFLLNIETTISEAIQNFSKDKAHLSPFFDGNCQMIGTSGILTTLAVLFRNSMEYLPDKAHGLNLASAQLKKIISTLYQLTYENSKTHSFIEPSKLDMILGGAALLKGILEGTKVQSVIATTRGLQHGILLDLIRKSTYSEAA